MKTLTKMTIAATILSVAFIVLAAGVKQMMVTDGKKIFSIVLWHIPFYRTIRLPDRSMWALARLWLMAVLVPPILWVTIGISHFRAKHRASNSAA